METPLTSNSTNVRLTYPQFLKPLYENFISMMNSSPNYIRNFLICTARGTGKTTTTMKFLELLWNKHFVVNIIKARDAKMVEFINQLVQTMRLDMGAMVVYNAHQRKLMLGKTVVRTYVLNPDKQNGNIPTGLAIDAEAEGVINIFDECAPDLDHKQVEILNQSSKTVQKTFIDENGYEHVWEVPKMNLYLCNPWSKQNYYIAKWEQALHWTREKALTEPYYAIKIIDGWCYIGASLWANPKCPDSDIQTYFENTEQSPHDRDIVFLGLAGMLNGQVFTNFEKMTYVDFSTEFDMFVGGIDLGYTDKGGNGGATVMELFKWNYAKGLSGVLEYYHHNKEVNITTETQQRLMIDKLYHYLELQDLTSPHRVVMIGIDVGGDASIVQTYRNLWTLNYEEKLTAKVYFFAVTTGLKRKWPLPDRYKWINDCLGYNFLHVSTSVQPHLYSDLESAVYEEKKNIKVEKDPDMDHEFSDTIVGGLSYAVITRRVPMLQKWRQRRKQDLELQKGALFHVEEEETTK